MTEATTSDTMRHEGHAGAPAEEPRVERETTTTELAKVGEAQESRAVTVRERLVARSAVAIWDTAALEHMGRVGAIMADSGLGSPTIFTVSVLDAKGKPTDAVEPAPRPMIIARCVMIANAARDAGADPLMFMQAVSIIQGKIHLEGKLVNAIIRKRTGVTLRFEFGLWDFDHIVFPERNEDGSLKDPDFFNKAEDRLSIRAFDPADPERFVDGSVGLWKTTRNGSPWSNPGNHRRQLRYRAAPEWARAYEPGAVIGLYSDADEDLPDEIDTPKPRQRRDLASKLTPAKPEGEAQEGAQGFNRAGVAEALGDGAGEASRGSGDVVECEHEFSGEGEDRACDHCGQLESDARPTTAADATATGGVQSADAEPATSGSAEGASDITAEGPETVEGAAPAGETYFLFGDAVNAEGKRVTYKDGVRFSTTKVLTKFKAYTEHAPEPVTTKEVGEPVSEGIAAAGGDVDLDQPCEACGALAGEPCAEDCPGEVEDEETAAEVQSEPETGFLSTLTPMKSWPDEFKPAIAALFKTSDYQTASDMEKDELRRAIWAKVVSSGAKVDHADDPSAYGLWLATMGNTRDDADAVEGTFNTLQRGERWGKMTPASRKPLEDRTAAKLKSIRGGNG